MKIACLQFNPQDDIEQNLETCEQMIAAAAQGSDIVVLPEMFPYMGHEPQRVETADSLDTGVFNKLRSFAKQYKVILVAGSHSERASTPTHVYNTSVTFSAEGEVLNVYRKIHLFNLRDANGNPLYCESDVFVGGERTEDFVIRVAGETWNAMTAICYDLRFPELFRGKRKTPLDVVFLPAAFTHQTGQDHWEVLLRARAIENQCYFIACNQTGSFAGGRKKNYGNSMIVDPWGRVVARLGEESGVLRADISKSLIVEARTRLPALMDRKLP